MYVANFAKESVHDYEGFFNKPTESEEIVILRKKIRSLQSQLEEYVSNLEMLKNTTSTDYYTPIEEQQILIYNGRYSTFSFDLNTGLPFDGDVSECQQINVGKKSGEFYLFAGYCYPLGSAIIKYYKYTIVPNNTKVTIQIVNEILIPLVDKSNIYFTHEKDGTIQKHKIHSRIISILVEINATNFIKEFYGIEKEVNFSLKYLKECISNNASFEIILRTARSEDFDCLLSLHSDKPLPIHKLLKITKEEYQILIEKNCLGKFISIKRLVEKYPEQIRMSTIDIINFIDNCRRWKENLDFYNIPSANLSTILLDYYIGDDWDQWKEFPKYYSFGKFSNYVVTETINQGYTSIGNLVNSLRDYIKMCVGVGLKPHLYTTSLELTHNVAARNYKIALTEEQEVIFKNRYIEFEPFENKDYVLIAPRTSEDVKHEGSSLNHCVASYIKDILDGNTQIFFLRLKKEYKNSLVTVEVRGKAIVQARGASNRDLTAEEEEVLKIFCADRKLAYKV